MRKSAAFRRTSGDYLCTGLAHALSGHDTRALQAYLGHRNIQHTVRYTELAPTRFKNFWRE
jgi:site-specific recombinase XerD